MPDSDTTDERQVLIIGSRDQSVVRTLIEKLHGEGNGPVSATVASCVQAKEPMHLRPCSCGENLHLYPDSPTWGGGEPYAVWCENCERWGPLQNTEDKAKRAWNAEGPKYSNDEMPSAAA